MRPYKGVNIMAFNPKSFEQIYEEMVQKTQQKVPGVTDFQVGSVIRTMYESFAYEVAVIYEQMNQVYQSAFIDTAESSQLDKVVSILGIQRGLPDYAQGVVTFERDMGNDEVEIPAGTIVSTEEGKISKGGGNSPSKKVYKTIESLIFPADQKTIDVKVQAVERGEEWVVPSEAIIVMPLPIPGIKSVKNQTATQFAGKALETDEELRKRSKNSLISSGKASLIAIQNALICLPEVRDVKLVEYFDGVSKNCSYGLVDIFVDGVDLSDDTKRQYLQAQVDRVRAAGVFARLKSATRIKIDAAFKIATAAGEKLPVSERNSLEKTVKKEILKFLEQLQIGQPLAFSHLVRHILSIPKVSNVEDFEIIAYVLNEKGEIEQSWYSNEEKNNQFTPHQLQNLKRIKPPQKLISKPVKKITLSDSIALNPSQPQVPFKVVSYDENSIWVAVEPVPVSVRVEIAASEIKQEDLTKLKKDVDSLLQDYFKTLKVGASVSVKEIKNFFLENLIKISLTKEQINNLPLAIFSTSQLCPLTVVTPDEINFSCVEQPSLDEKGAFIYSQELEIIGALKFQSKKDLSLVDKDTIKQKILKEIQSLIAQLKPEESLALSALQNRAQSVSTDITIPSLVPEDFSFKLDNKSQLRQQRLPEDKIQIGAFEKAKITYFCVTGDVEDIDVEITNLSVHLILTKIPSNCNHDEAQARFEIKNTISTALNNLAQKKPKGFSYEEISGAVINAIAQFNIYQISLKKLTIKAISQGDKREQIISQSNQENYVRSVEVIKTIKLTDTSTETPESPISITFEQVQNGRA